MRLQGEIGGGGGHRNLILLSKALAFVLDNLCNIKDKEWCCTIFTFLHLLQSVCSRMVICPILQHNISPNMIKPEEEMKH